jgi:hypothetical protein
MIFSVHFDCLYQCAPGDCVGSTLIQTACDHSHDATTHDHRRYHRLFAVVHAGAQTHPNDRHELDIFGTSAIFDRAIPLFRLSRHA